MCTQRLAARFRLIFWELTAERRIDIMKRGQLICSSRLVIVPRIRALAIWVLGVGPPVQAGSMITFWGLNLGDPFQHVSKSGNLLLGGMAWTGLNADGTGILGLAPGARLSRAFLGDLASVFPTWLSQSIEPYER